MTYLITGGAGFIGANLAAHLVGTGAAVRILDDFSTGKQENLLFEGRERLEVIAGDIRDPAVCRRAMQGVTRVFHHAALASVPASVADPVRCHDINVTGTLHLLAAAREAGVERFVFASSAAVYGNRPDEGEGGPDGEVPPKHERLLPDPLSPYAASKLAGEHYCRIFHDLYGLPTFCFRYFNIYGPRQDPASEYAAAVPRFIQAFLEGRPPVLYGDGLQSRDFVFVEDVVRANLLACEAPATIPERVFNLAGQNRISLLELLAELSRLTGRDCAPVFAPPRPGDVRHSWADIRLARDCLGFVPAWPLRTGLRETLRWYRDR